MLLGLSESLPSLVESKFKAAQAAKSLIFSPTELTVIHTTAGLPFQLRYCPSLTKKPTTKKNETPQTKKPDPFDNPPADLLIAEVPTTNSTHLLVLNKYPIILEHFILATKTSKLQTHQLEQEDLEATYACLKAWENGHAHGRSRKLFAFFNSGEHSGASQPHRHLQFIPIENMINGEESDGWELLMDQILATPRSIAKSAPDLKQNPKLPFTHYASPLSSDPSGSQLLRTYQELYKAAATSVNEHIQSHPNDLELHSTEDGSLPISYNLAMTTSAMAICPRRREGNMLQRDDGSDIGFVALNGTALAGTLMVKHREEWDVLRAEPEKLDKLLKAIGVPLEAGNGQGDDRNRL